MFVFAACGPNAMDAMCTSQISPASDAATNHTNIQTAFGNAQKGNVICLHGGTYSLQDELDLSVDNVEIRSMTDGQAILDFKGQQHGANGLLITGNGDKVNNVTVKNTPGDAIRANQVTGITFLNVTVTWDGGADTSNGAYGLYPVQSTHVLIDGCKVSYASDAGIYVGQSSQVLIRNSEAFGNVAGIEFENTTDAEGVNNYSHDNTGGILIFNLPNLMMQGGARTNLHNNRIDSNNGMNFAAKSSIVHNVPSGTGVLVMAAANNEVHDNMITNNGSTALAVVSYLLLQMCYMDPNYYPYPTGNYLHDNQFSGNGQYPSGLANTLAAAIGDKTITDLVWDGMVDPQKPLDMNTTNCFHANGSATFTNLNAAVNNMCTLTGLMASTDVSKYDCMHAPLPSITP